MFRKRMLTALVVVMMLVVALMPSMVSAQGRWPWKPVWPNQPQQPSQPGWALVSSQLFVDEGAYGQLVLTMRLTSNSQKLEQAQAVVTLGQEVNGYFANSNSWGVSASGKNASWVVQLQPRQDLTADVIIQLNGGSLRQGCLIATMRTSVRNGAYWQPSGSLQVFKNW